MFVFWLLVAVVVAVVASLIVAAVLDYEPIIADEDDERY